MNRYDIGNVSILTGTFFNTVGQLTDPSSVLCRVKDPTGVVTVYSGSDITHVSVGVYSMNLPLNLVGLYFYRFEGTGALTATGDSQLQVYDSIVLD